MNLYYKNAFYFDCYPMSNFKEDTGNLDINSEERRGG